MSDLGRAVGAYIGGVILMACVGGVVLGVALTIVVPWIYRHVSISFT